MLQGIFGKSPELAVFGESDAEAMDGYRLRPVPVIEGLIEQRSPKRCLFKPICDSHYADHLLNAFAGARAVWIYRDFADVVRSGMKKWPGHYLQIAERFLSDDASWLGWRTERLLPETHERVLALFRLGLSEAEAGVVFWALRNQAFFDWGFDVPAFLRLVRYESIAADPVGELARLFAFFDLDFDPRFADGVRRDSVRSTTAEEFRSELRMEVLDLCSDLSDRLHAVRSRHASASS